MSQIYGLLTFLLFVVSGLLFLCLSIERIRRFSVIRAPDIGEMRFYRKPLLMKKNSVHTMHMHICDIFFLILLACVRCTLLCS